MKKRKSVTFIKRYLLLTVLTVVIIVVATILVPMGSIGATVALILIVLDVFSLLAMLALSLVNLIRHLSSRDIGGFEFLYIFNFIFATLVTSLFMVFYFIIFFGALIILLPFIA